MNTINPFDALVSLATVDKKMIEVQRSLQLLAQKNEEMQTTLAKLTQDSQEKESAFQELKKALKESEIEHKSVVDTLLKKKNQLETSSSARESQSLYQDISELENKKNALEERVLSLWQEVEDMQNRYDAAVQAYEKRRQVLVQERQKNFDKLTSLQNEASTLSQEAADLYLLLNPTVRASYLKMKELVSNPAVEVIENRCTGCYYPVSSQDLADLRKHKILTCKDCYRLLYMR